MIAGRCSEARAPGITGASPGPRADREVGRSAPRGCGAANGSQQSAAHSHLETISHWLLPRGDADEWAARPTATQERRR